MPMPLTIGTSRALLGQADPAVAWLALLQSQATYAWDGVQGLSLASWVDVVAGVSAAAAGTGTTLGTLNGRAAAVFNGAGRYQTPPLAVVQPYAMLWVWRFSEIGAPMTVSDALANTSAMLIATSVTATIQHYNPSPITLIDASANQPYLLRALLNGTSSVYVLNNVEYTRNPGTGGLDGLTIGSRGGGSNGMRGPIAHVSIYAGAKFANAATVAAAAQQYYGIS